MLTRAGLNTDVLLWLDLLTINGDWRTLTGQTYLPRWRVRLDAHYRRAWNAGLK